MASELELPEGCPACGALPIDWAGGANPHAYLTTPAIPRPPAKGDASRMADLLTKAVGDVTAALLMAGKKDKIAAWTAPYIEALNDFDTPAPSQSEESAAEPVAWIYTHPEGYRNVTTQPDMDATYEGWRKANLYAHPAPASNTTSVGEVERVARAVEIELGVQEMVLADPMTIRRLQDKRIARAALAAIRSGSE